MSGEANKPVSRKELSDTIAGRNTFIRLGLLALLTTYIATIELGFNAAFKDYESLIRYQTAHTLIAKSLEQRTAELRAIYAPARHGVQPHGRRSSRRMPAETQTAGTSSLGGALAAAPPPADATPPPAASTDAAPDDEAAPADGKNKLSKRKIAERNASRAHEKLEATATKARDVLRAKKKAILLRFASTTAVPLPGIQLNLPFNLVAMAWLLGACYLIAYAGRARQRSYRELKQLAKCADDDKLTAHDSPLWLAPLPWERDAFQRDAARAFETPGPFSRNISLLALAATTVCFGLCLRVAELNHDWTIILSSIARDNIAEAFDWTGLTWLSIVQPFLSLALLMATMAFYFLSLPAAAAGHHGRIDMSRRTMLAAGAAGLAAIAAGLGYGAALQWQNGYLRRKAETIAKRVRRRRIGDRAFQTPLAKGFYVNPRGGLLHHVDAHGRSYGLRPETHFREFKRADAPSKTRLSGSRLPLVIEEAALQSFDVGKDGKIRPTKAQCETACAILLQGIHQLDAQARRRFDIKARPNYRLIDLAAGIAYRYGLTDVLAELVSICGVNPFISDRRFQKDLVARNHLFVQAITVISERALEPPSQPPPAPGKHPAKRTYRYPRLTSRLGRWSENNPTVRYGTFSGLANPKQDTASLQFVYFISPKPPRTRPLSPGLIKG
jgi:hypothetical protein